MTKNWSLPILSVRDCKLASFCSSVPVEVVRAIFAINELANASPNINIYVSIVATKVNKVTWKASETTPRINGVIVIVNLPHKAVINPQPEKDKTSFFSSLVIPFLISNLIFRYKRI